MNAARIMKSLGMNRDFNRTEREVITNMQGGMILNAAKIWDGTGYNIKKFVKKSDANGDEITTLLLKLSELEVKHEVTIKNVKKWRNKLVAHLDNNINSTLFNNFDGDVADIQAMLKDVADFVSTASWYPEKNRPMKFLDYDQIERDLRL